MDSEMLELKDNPDSRYPHPLFDGCGRRSTILDDKDMTATTH
ncbi:MAG TPA: hypothetical protein VGI46_02045 [Candidatus Acidoferrum sp.]